MSTALKIPVRMARAEFLTWNAPANQLWPFVDSERRATAPGVIPRVQAEINFRVPGLAVTCSSAFSRLPGPIEQPISLFKGALGERCWGR